MHFTFPFRPHSLRSHKGHIHSGSGKCVWGGEGASLSHGPWVSLSQHCVWINQQSPDLERHPFFRFKSIHSPPPTIACWVSETHWTPHVQPGYKDSRPLLCPTGHPRAGTGVRCEWPLECSKVLHKEGRHRDLQNPKGAKDVIQKLLACPRFCSLWISVCCWLFTSLFMNVLTGSASLFTAPLPSSFL